MQVVILTERLGHFPRGYTQLFSVPRGDEGCAHVPAVVLHSSWISDLFMQRVRNAGACWLDSKSPKVVSHEKLFADRARLRRGAERR